MYITVVGGLGHCCLCLDQNFSLRSHDGTAVGAPTAKNVQRGESRTTALGIYSRS